MSIRNRALILAIAGCALPAVAGGGEVGLLYAQQYGKDQMNGSQDYAEVKTSTAGIRAGWTFADLKVVEFSFIGTYQPKAEADLLLNGTKIGKYGVSYGALGAQVGWKFLVNFNVGIEYRQEKLTSDRGALGKYETTLNRPWARAGIGFSIPLPVVSPFFRVEIAAPLTKEDISNSPEAIAKAMAPQGQAGVYVGIRF